MILRRKHSILTLAALTASVLTIGCGGGDGDSSNSTNASQVSSGDSSSTPEPVTTTSLSKAEYVKQVNQLCVKRREDRFYEVNEFAKENTGKSQQELLPEVARTIYGPALDKQFEEMRALGAPPGAEDQIEEMMVAFEKVGDLFVQQEGGQSVKINKEIEHAGRIARKFNLDKCSFI